MKVGYPPVAIGGLARPELLSALASSGVRLNRAAETLLGSEVFDIRIAETIQPVAVSVGDLGLATGASLSQILAAGSEHGLSACPLTAAPYLRLAMLRQETAPDSILSSGRVPSGSITVASMPPRAEADERPTGFYLRVIDGTPWLRGYHCADEYGWPDTAQFMFQRAAESV